MVSGASRQLLAPCDHPLTDDLPPCCVADKYPVLDSWESIPVWGRTSPRTDSDEAYELACNWIDECLGSSHRHCKSPKSPLLPRRVVDVGVRDGVIRLLETNGARGKYLCLSHCWGAQQIITTTKASKAAHEHEITLESLPQTFRDAVLFTRRFGIDYIWIDSLCIVQDDGDDWKTESAKMEAVYRNAHLTLAATSSSSGAAGFYRPTPDYEVSGTSESGQSYSLFFREKIDHHIENIGNPPDFSHQADDREIAGRPTSARHPLLTRAWVFQERLLSTRVLHFGPYELFFECRTGMQCECDGIGYADSSETVAMPATKPLYDDTLGNHSLHRKVGDRLGYRDDWAARLWRTMASSYTALGITHPRDRLPAIGGLAKSMRALRASDYLAGLWRDSLADDLLWTVNANPVGARPSPRSAPTWSWASVAAPVLYHDEILFWHPDVWVLENSPSSKTKISRHLAEVVSCTVRPDGVDEFGMMAGGTLEISGAVREGILEKEETRGGKPVTTYHVSFPGVRHPIKSDYLLDHAGPDPVSPGSTVTCIRMSVVCEGSIESLVSLVLRPSGTEPTTFERIGVLLIETRTPPVDIESGIYGSAAPRTVVIE